MSLLHHIVAYCFIAFVLAHGGRERRVFQTVVLRLNCYRQEYHRSRRTVSVKAARRRRSTSGQIDSQAITTYVTQAPKRAKQGL